MINFKPELWNIHQFCVLQVLNAKRQFQQEKQTNLAKAEMSRQNFKGTNRYNVATKKKLNSS